MEIGVNHAIGEKVVRIALVHAVQVAMAPVQAAFDECWPEAKLMNVLDDSLPGDLEAAGSLRPEMTSRFASLVRYCTDQGAAAVLFTCSAFGPAIEAAAQGANVPVLKPNEAMFEKALLLGKRVGMIATFPPAVAPMEAEFYKQARTKGSTATIRTYCFPEALQAAKEGDYVRHNQIVAEAVSQFDNVDVLLLAHFSMVPALEMVKQRTAVPVLTSPHAAIEKLRRCLG